MWITYSTPFWFPWVTNLHIFLSCTLITNNHWGYMDYIWRFYRDWYDGVAWKLWMCSSRCCSLGALCVPVPVHRSFHSDLSSCSNWYDSRWTWNGVIWILFRLFGCWMRPQGADQLGSGNKFNTTTLHIKNYNKLTIHTATSWLHV